MAAAHINPSVLAADFVHMAAELDRIRTADEVHVDVMDNHFVPNLTFGPQMVGRIHDVSPVPLDVHLMIEDPDRWAPEYARLGAEGVTFHLEAAREPFTLAQTLAGLGARPGVAVKPGTDPAPLLDHLDLFGMVLVMTVEPGFGGQRFMPETMPKLRLLRRAADERGLDLRLEVDGGITAETIRTAAAAGADTFVAGSSVFGGASPIAAIAALRVAADETLG
ncbi:MAG TPA: ribulose-phosphate 3-epimerase [Microbacteriaceae bacterium]|nr:ribulose-phosphate 3-epimerase [Microbacteriaceae bacterium]